MSETSILIVEDEAIVAADLANKLGQLGYLISGTTGSGKAAVELARRQRPDLILMDIRLEGRMDGIEAADLIRRECDLPVIFLTAHSDQATLQRAKLTEPFGYILKPFEELDLETHIQMALYKHTAEQQLRESEARFRTTFEHAAVPTALTGPDHRFLRINTAFRDFIGYSETQLLGREFCDVIHPDDWVGMQRSLERVVSGKLLSYREEHRFRPEKGHDCWGDVSSAAVRNAHGAPLYVITQVQDITRRKQVELDLARSHEALQMTNEELETANEELKATNEELRSTGQELTSSNEQLAKLTEQLRTTNEQLERRVLERTAQLRALAGKLAESEERERRRIAKILHDDLQQLLVGARLHLDAVRRQLASPPAQEDLQHVEELLGDALDVTRDLSHELSPAVLRQEGLTAALEWLAARMDEHHHLRVRLYADPEVEPLNESLKVSLFHAVRELLFNVVKHAGVSCAEVRLMVHSSHELEVEVSDKGKGFNPALAATNQTINGGYGLFGIQEHLHLLGGQMEVESTPGHGSRFRLLVPLQRPEPTKEKEAAPEPVRPNLPRPRRAALADPPSRHAHAGRRAHS